MPSRDIESIANLLDLLPYLPSEEALSLLGMVSCNLRALAEQVTMLEDIPLTTDIRR